MKHSITIRHTATAWAAVVGVCLTTACSSDETVPADSTAAATPAPVAAPAAPAVADAPKTGDVIGGVKVLKPIVAGMPNESIFTYTGVGPLTATGADSTKLANGFLRSQVTTNGELITVIWYRNTPGKLTDPVYRALNTPIVLGEQTVKGWGWSFYDSVADSLKLPKIAQ
jgi:hypothetical protein